MTNKLQFHFQNPEESSGYLLWQVSMIWQRQMNRTLGELNITHTQFVLLATIGWLSKGKSEVTQVEIATHSNTDRMMVSKVISTLQDKDLIQRIEHSTDTRAKSISLTKKGTDLLQKTLKLVEQVDENFFSHIASSTNSFNRSMKVLFENNQ